MRAGAALGALICAGLLTASASAARAQRGIEIQPVVSPGGIEAWLVSSHRVPVINVSVIWKGGAAGDPRGKEGLTNLMSGLLDEGAGALSAQAFQERLSARAIRLRFDAGRDGFYARLRTLAVHRREAFALLREAITRPRFDREPVERVRGQVLALLRARASDPADRARRAWFEAALPPGHPYAHAVEGTADSVAAITARDLHLRRAEVLTRKDVIVVVVGAMDKAELAGALDEIFGGLEQTRAGRREARPAVGAPQARRLRLAQAGGQTTIMFGHDGLRRDDPDFTAAYVMNHILGSGGFASRLMKEARAKRGLVYSIHTRLLPLELGGLFWGMAATRDARAGETLALIRAELERMRAEGVSARELADAKAYLTGAYALRFDGGARIAAQLAAIWRDGLGIDYVARRNRLIEAVRLEDVRRAARRLLHPERLVVVTVGGEAEP